MRKNRTSQVSGITAHTANLLIVAAITFLCITFAFDLSPAFSQEIPQKMPTENTHTNSIGMKFVRIKPGTFTMGHEGELPDHIKNATEFSGSRKVWLPGNGDYDERPTHKVTITKPFYMSVTEVTNNQFEQFDRLHLHLRGKKAFSIDHDEAFVFVSWYKAKAFCAFLCLRYSRLNSSKICG